MAKAKLVHYFADTDLRCTHTGLLALLKKKKIEIKSDEYICFMNHRSTMLKMFCKGSEALFHYRRDDGHRIDPGVIKYLPKYLDGGEMNMDAAAREHIEDSLARRGVVLRNAIPAPKSNAKKKAQKKNETRKPKKEMAKAKAVAVRTILRKKENKPEQTTLF